MGEYSTITVRIPRCARAAFDQLKERYDIYHMLGCVYDVIRWMLDVDGFSAVRIMDDALLRMYSMLLCSDGEPFARIHLTSKRIDVRGIAQGLKYEIVKRIGMYIDEDAIVLRLIAIAWLGMRRVCAACYDRSMVTINDVMKRSGVPRLYKDLEYKGAVVIVGDGWISVQKDTTVYVRSVDEAIAAYMSGIHAIIPDRRVDVERILAELPGAASAREDMEETRIILPCDATNLLMHAWSTTTKVVHMLSGEMDRARATKELVRAKRAARRAAVLTQGFMSYAALKLEDIIDDVIDAAARADNTRLSGLKDALWEYMRRIATGSMIL